MEKAAYKVTIVMFVICAERQHKRVDAHILYHENVNKIHI
jgi:hypothetical protein